MTKRILSVTFAGVLVSAALAVAHAGHEHKAMGTVAAVDAKHIEVADKDGKKTSFLLTPETKYRHGTMAAEASHVTVGQRVVVFFLQDENDQTNTATRVLLGVTEKDAAPAKPHGH